MTTGKLRLVNQSSAFQAQTDQVNGSPMFYRRGFGRHRMTYNRPHTFLYIFDRRAGRMYTPFVL